MWHVRQGGTCAGVGLVSGLQILSMIGAVGSLVGAALMIAVSILQTVVGRQQRAQRRAIDETLANLEATQRELDAFLAEARGTP